MRMQTWPSDLLCVSAELLTGKSIPVLVGIVRLPIDRWIACLMLCMGVIAGAFLSVYSSRVVLHGTGLGYANRLIQLGFSLFLSLSLLLSVAKGIHYERGVIMCIVPAFCVIVQTLPQRSSTALVAFLLSLVFLVVGVSLQTSTTAQNGITAQQQQQPTIVHSLVGLHTIAEESVGVREIVARAVQLFILAFYASFQHAPTHPYKTTQPPAFYVSSHYDHNTRYATLVGLMGAWLRVASWYIVCFFQDNAMHVILENDHSMGGWNWACCMIYMTTLLFSACWTATQLREQVLAPLLVDSGTIRLKTVAFILAIAAFYRQRDADVTFLATNLLSVFALLTIALTLK